MKINPLTFLCSFVFLIGIGELIPILKNSLSQLIILFFAACGYAWIIYVCEDVPTQEVPNSSIKLYEMDKLKVFSGKCKCGNEIYTPIKAKVLCNCGKVIISEKEKKI